MSKSVFLTACVAILLAGWSRAQESSNQSTETKNTLPPGPLIVTQMPKFAQWSIDYTYTDGLKPGQDSPALAQYKKLAEKDPEVAKELADPRFVATLNPNRPLHVVVTTTGDIRHEERSLEQGQESELWGEAGYTAERKPGAPKLFVNMFGIQERNEFPEFFWLSKASFTGIETDNGHKCLAFKQDIDPVQLLYSSSGFTGNGTKIPVIAHIDFTTRYPVSLQFGVETRQYTFLSPPTSPLDVPDEFVSAIKEMQTRSQKATAGTSPP